MNFVNRYNYEGRSPAWNSITASEAKAVMNSSVNAKIVDVRTREEFARDHIPGAVNLVSEELLTVDILHRYS